MSTYAQVFIIQLKTELAYRFNALMNALGCVLRVLFARIVWGAVYTGAAVIGGLTLEEMIGYTLLSTAIAQMDMSDGEGQEISARLRDGTFSKYMVVPVNIQAYFLTQSLGASAFYALVNALAVTACAGVFGVRLPLTREIATVLPAVTMIVLGLAVMAQLHFLIGLMTLRFENIDIFLMMKRHFVAFLSGALVPLSLLGPGVETAMRAFPFYYTAYLPSMLLLGYRQAQAAEGLAVLALWLIGLTALNTYAYARMRVRYDGVGI